MNYCLADKKRHKNDLLIPPRGVYLELHREIYETIGNRQRVNEVWEATLRLPGTHVDEEHIKPMRNGSGIPTVFQAMSQTPSEDHMPADWYKSTNPFALPCNWS